MSKVRSQLRHGLWPDIPSPARQASELTPAARRLATLEELGRLGVGASHDDDGRAHFRSIKVPPGAPRRLIATHGDLVQQFLREQRETLETVRLTEAKPLTGETSAGAALARPDTHRGAVNRA